MSDDALLKETLDAMLSFAADPREKSSSDGNLGDIAWQRLECGGLLHVFAPEQLGGGGGSHADGVAVLRAIGAAGLSVPILENQLAGMALVAAGQAVPNVPAAAVVDGLRLRSAAGHWRLSGRATRVGRAERTQSLTVVDAGLVAVVDAEAGRWTSGHNIASELRQTWAVDLILEDCAVWDCPSETAVWLREWATLGRAALIVGAAEMALSSTVAHVSSRIQFGRALSGFQTVQHSVAGMAALLTAAVSAVQSAASIFPDSPATSAGLSIAVSSAKYQSNLMAVKVARVAHQLHGAMGFTLEHPLVRATRRLWAWASEDGSQRACSLRLAQLAGDDPWHAITADL